MGLARTIAYCLKLRANDKRSLAQLTAIQQRNLKAVVRFAKHHSPYYGRLYRDIDVNANGFSVRDLPPVTKSTLMNHFDEVVTDRSLRLMEVMDWGKRPETIGQWYKRRYVITHTSGTTGEPAFFVYNRREWDWIQAMAVTRGVRFTPNFLEFLRCAHYALRNKVRVALVGVLSGHFVTQVLFRLKPHLVSKGSHTHFLSVVEPVPNLVQHLNEIQPNLLHCYPTMLEVLAYEQMEGRLHIQPWLITCSSEPLVPSARKVIETAFPTSQVFENYGTSEGVILAGECPLHRGMHINHDTFVIESVREDGSPCASGELGDKVFLSVLFARTMPLLRYEINDVVLRVDEPCACGSPFPLLKVRGRTDDTFWVLDPVGKPVALPPIPFEALFLNIEGLTQYQLIQETRNHLRILFCPRKHVDPNLVLNDIRKRFGDYLTGKGLNGCVTLEISVVGSIPRNPQSGKIRQIYSKVERLFLPGDHLGLAKPSDLPTGSHSVFFNQG